MKHDPLQARCHLGLEVGQDEDFAALERIVLQAHEREPLPILAWCLMGNHWHFVVRPTKEGQMSRFFRWLTLTHAVRWGLKRGGTETGT